MAERSAMGASGARHDHWQQLVSWLRGVASRTSGQLELVARIDFADGVPQTAEVLREVALAKFGN